jgi:hypothetical protein
MKDRDPSELDAIPCAPDHEDTTASCAIMEIPVAIAILLSSDL